MNLKSTGYVGLVGVDGLCLSLMPSCCVDCAYEIFFKMILIMTF